MLFLSIDEHKRAKLRSRPLIPRGDAAMARARAGMMARKAFRPISAMRGRSCKVRVGFNGPVDLLAVSSDVIVVIAIAGIERRRETE